LLCVIYWGGGGWGGGGVHIENFSDESNKVYEDEAGGFLRMDLQIEKKPKKKKHKTEISDKKVLERAGGRLASFRG